MSDRILLGVGALAALAVAAAATYDNLQWRCLVSFRLPFGFAVSVGRAW